MSNRTISKTAADLIKARALIEDEGNWCKYALHDAHGRHCALGAVQAATRHNRLAAVVALAHSAEALFGTSSVADVNNKIGHAAVKRLYDHAIQSELNKAGKP